MLAKGFILGKDAIAKAKSVEEKHQLTSTASAKVASLDKKLGFTDKINTGTVVVGDKNRYVLTGATWVTGAFNKVAKAAEEVGQKAKEKVGMAEEEDKRKVVDEFARVHLSESPKAPSSKEDDVHEPKRSESPEPKESEHQEPQQQQQSSQPVGPAQP
ncbi:hypothetical protein Bca52824_071052 [Brassica carinata]|uniref:Uncharacterized protein n=1 Tax=Brassica carinata TaxID=52824 RepID=A0A8X7Q9C4_BRACI|nr:hypothetical protein Bca52824_071052 [Brassica carinata]